MGDIGEDGRIILMWIFNKWDVGVWPGLICSEQGQMGSCCECGNEPSGSIKMWEIS
jgi:hypothetical protein